MIKTCIPSLAGCCYMFCAAVPLTGCSCFVHRVVKFVWHLKNRYGRQVSFLSLLSSSTSRRSVVAISALALCYSIGVAVVVSASSSLPLPRRSQSPQAAIGLAVVVIAGSDVFPCLLAPSLFSAFVVVSGPLLLVVYIFCRCWLVG